jgi:hypothetical protein
MNHLLQSIVALILVLTIFFNIERLDIGTENALNIETFVYLFGAVAAIFTISFKLPVTPRYRFYGTLILWLGIYLISKLYLFGRNPLLGDTYTYLTITEVAFLSILIFSAHKLAYNLHDFEQAVRNITFAGSNKIQDLEKATEKIQNEIFRSCHYHHALSVIVVEPEPSSIRVSINRIVQEIQQKMITRYVLTGLDKLLKDELRQIDLVVKEDDKGRFIVLCPETDISELAQLTTRIQAAAMARLGLTVTCGTATFPEEAVTFDSLVNQAEQRLRRPTASSSYNYTQSSADLRY